LPFFRFFFPLVVVALALRSGGTTAPAIHLSLQVPRLHLLPPSLSLLHLPHAAGLRERVDLVLVLREVVWEKIVLRPIVVERVAGAQPVREPGVLPARGGAATSREPVREPGVLPARGGGATSPRQSAAARAARVEPEPADGGPPGEGMFLI